MPFCVSCGAEHPAGARFCPACGAPVAAAPAPPGQPPSTRKIVTVVFVDLVGSTSLGERIDSEAVQGVLSRYFDEAAAVLRRHGGTVEKFIGDAVVAVFGVPEAHEDDALRAVRAAVEIRDAVADLSATTEATYGIPLKVRIGINTGEVVVGDASTGQSFSVGDAMNVGARLEQAASPDEILLGPMTYGLVRDAVRTRAAAGLQLRGKTEHTDAWSLVEVLADHPARQRRLDAPLVGRDAELDVLDGWSGTVRTQGTCRLGVILGEAGVGKSKLAAEFGNRLERGVPILRGRCLSYGEGITFWPVAEALRDDCGILDTDSRETVRDKVRSGLIGHEAARAADILTDVLTGQGRPNAQDVFWAVRQALESRARGGLVIVLVDDLQWAEPTFLDLLEYLAGRAAGQLLFVCTARPDVLEARPQWATNLDIDTLALRALGPDQVGSLVGALLGAGASSELESVVVEASEGNPLYVEEMLRMLAEEGLLEERGNRWETTRPLIDISVPASIHALIAARLDRVDPADSAVLQRGAVVGAEFWTGSVLALSDDGGEQSVVDRLHALVRRDFLRPHPSTFADEDAYRFSHGLVREVSYGTAPKRVRAVLHARFADWLQQRAAQFGEYDEILGHHLAQAAGLRRELGIVDAETAELSARGARLLAGAGRRALARSDLPAAAKLLRRSISLTDDVLDRALSRLDLCDCLRDMGNLEPAQEVLAAAEADARDLADRRLGARVAVMRALLSMHLDEPLDEQDAAVAMPGALAVLRDAGDDLGCAQAYRVLADVHLNDSQFEAATGDLEAALEHAERADDPRERGVVVTWLASALLWGPAHADDGIQRCEATMSSAAGNRMVEAKTLIILAGLYAMRDRFEEARDAYRRSRTMLDELGMTLTAASGTQVSGMVEMLAGDAAAAERQFRDGYAALQRMGERGYLSAAAAFLARSLLAQDRADDAEPLAAELAELLDPGDEAARADYQLVAAQLSRSRGDHDEAVALAHAAVAAFAGTDELKSHADALCQLAVCLVGAGRSAEAREVAAQARDLYERKGVVPALRAVDGLLAELA